LRQAGASDLGEGVVVGAETGRGRRDYCIGFCGGLPQGSLLELR